MKFFNFKTAMRYGVCLSIAMVCAISISTAQADARIAKVIAMSEYHALPLNQVFDSLDFGVVVKNEGMSKLTNVQMKYELTRSGNVILRDSIIEDSLIVGGTALIQINTSYVPTTVGVYCARYTITHDDIDSTPTNNISTVDTLIIGDTSLQRYRNKMIGGSFCPPNLTQGEAGSIFRLHTSDFITSVTAGISNMGNRFSQLKLSANLRAFVNGKPDSIIATSDTLTISNYASQYVTFNFRSPVFMNTDTFMVSIVQEDSCISLGASSKAQIATNDHGVNWFWSSGLQNGNWIMYFDPNNNLGLMIRPNFGSSGITKLEIENKTLLEFNIFPNPMQEQASIQFTLTKSADVEISIYDLFGRIVSQEFNKDLPAGSFKHTLSRNYSFRKKGAYILLMRVNGQPYSKQIVVL